MLGMLATLAAAAPAPPIHHDPVPFPPERKRQMRAYSNRHYGIGSYRLVRPRVIDKRGTINRLVSLRLMCRHTVGLNYTSIGIEHVGLSDAEVIGNDRQISASLRLTRWLQGRHGIATRHVIGHAESPSSPYHRERVARLRRQTHGDWSHRNMVMYR